MQNIIPTVWISSIDHLNSFSALSKENPWWKLILGLNKVPADFPQVKVGWKKYPLVMFSAGALTFFERQLEFRANNANSTNRLHFINLKDDLRFDIPYSSLTVTRYTHPKPFLKAFNISWIKLTVSDNSSVSHFLVSFGGKNLSKNQVELANDELFEVLKKKISAVF